MNSQEQKSAKMRKIREYFVNPKNQNENFG